MNAFVEMDEQHLSMNIDNSKMLITIYTESFRQETSEDGFSEKGNYVLNDNAPAYKKPVGELLFSFINADFETQEGFEKFIAVWGLPGFLEIEEHHKLDYAYVEYTENDYRKTVQSFYNATKYSLIKAQASFKQVVDFCICSEGSLKELTPIQRYYVGEYKDKIPDLDVYSKKYYVSYKVIRNYENCNDAAEEFMSEMKKYSFDDLCQSVKTDTMETKTTYHTRNIITFVYMEFFNLLRNFSLGKCENCGKYFVPVKSTEIYCDDCRHIGYINKVKNDEFLRAYNTAYKTKHAEMQRKTRHGKFKNTEQYRQALAEWRDNARMKLEEAQGGKISFEEYKEFLKKRLEV